MREDVPLLGIVRKNPHCSSVLLDMRKRSGRRRQGAGLGIPCFCILNVGILLSSLSQKFNSLKKCRNFEGLFR